MFICFNFLRKRKHLKIFILLYLCKKYTVVCVCANLTCLNRTCLHRHSSAPETVEFEPKHRSHNRLITKAMQYN